MKCLKILFIAILTLTLCSCQPKLSKAEAISTSYTEALSDMESLVKEYTGLLDITINEDCNRYFDNLHLIGLLAEGVESPTFQEYGEEWLEEDEKTLGYIQDELSYAKDLICELEEEIENLRIEYECELEEIKEKYEKD